MIIDQNLFVRNTFVIITKISVKRRLLKYFQFIAQLETNDQPSTTYVNGIG